MLKTSLPSLPCPIFATSAANIKTCKLNTLYYPKEVFCKIDRHRAFTLASCWCCTHSDCLCPVPALQEWKCLKAFVWLVGVKGERRRKMRPFGWDTSNLHRAVLFTDTQASEKGSVLVSRPHLHSPLWLRQQLQFAQDLQQLLAMDGRGQADPEQC